MAFIEVIQHNQAGSRLKEIYDDLILKRGKLAEVHKIQSLNPDSIVLHMDLYLGIMFGKSPLKRYQREMIAVIVSATNNCEYCVNHHGEALNHFWKDDSKIESLAKDFNKAGLNSQDLMLCDFAQMVTAKPWMSRAESVEQLKANGLSDRAILDAALVIAYFNFVNRMVLSLGVELESEGGKGYRYD